MNANSSPPAQIIIKQWLGATCKNLSGLGISSARLDALILLEDELRKDRSWILAHDDYVLNNQQIDKLNNKVAQRAKHIPLAYIRGFVEFYGRQFKVTPDVLIPRPETEELVELALHLQLPADATVIDIGTGSGCIAITLKKERPHWRVSATDISAVALEIAKQNSISLGTSITFVKSDLLSLPSSPILQSPVLITANLPYVAHSYEISPNAKAEPEVALFAKDHGYALIENLLPQAAEKLQSNGYLLLESDPWQQERIINIAKNYGFIPREQRRFHIVLQKL